MMRSDALIRLLQCGACHACFFGYILFSSCNVQAGQFVDQVGLGSLYNPGCA